MATESLQLAIIACLTREGYKLRTEISLDGGNHIFFFVKSEQCRQRLRLAKSVPDMGGSRGRCQPPTRRATSRPVEEAWWRQTSTDSSGQSEE